MAQRVQHVHVVLLASILAVGCEAIAGIDERVADPLVDAAAGAGGSAGAAGSAGTTPGGAAGDAGAAGSSGAGAGGVAGAAGVGGQQGGSSGEGGAAGAGQSGAAGAGQAGAAGGTAGGGAGGAAGQSGAAGAAGSTGTCLPVGVPTLRIGNLVPDTKRYDVCIKSLDPPDPKAPPLLSKPECPDGLGYKDVTGLFHVDPGAYEIKIVDASATTCDGPGIATLSPTIIADGKLTAVYMLGDGNTAPTLQRYLESRPSQAVGAKLRLLHAAAGLPAMDFGIGSDAKLPADVSAPIFTNVAFGGVAAPGPVPGGGAIDANGYNEYMIGGGSVPHALAPTGKATGILATDEKLDGGRASTAFVVGTTDRPGFPLQLYTCDEVAAPVGSLARCSNGVAIDLAVETYNAQLTGSFIVQSEGLRRAALVDQVSKPTSDVLCVTEVWNEPDKLAFANAAKANYPYSYWVKTDLSTPVDDPKDINGNVPPAPTTAPCAASAAKFKTAMDCVRDKCVAPLMSEDGVPQDGIAKCMSSSCVAPIIGLTLGSTDDKQCWGCMFQELNGYATIGATRNACTTNPKARYAFDGQGGSMILSKYPINGASSWVLPATDFRVNVLRAPVTLPNGAEVDAYCSVLTTPATSCTTRPYTGQYGGGETDCVKAWQAELKLQTQKLIGHVQQKSGAFRRRAFVMGEMYSGPGYNDGTTDILKARYPDIYALFPQAFASAAIPGDVPKCTLCSDNTWLTPPGGTTPIDSTKTSAIFLEDVLITQVKATSTTKTDAVVMFDPGGGVPPYLVPASPYYGSRAVVRVEP